MREQRPVGRGGAGADLADARAIIEAGRRMIERGKLCNVCGTAPAHILQRSVGQPWRAVCGACRERRNERPAARGGRVHPSVADSYRRLAKAIGA